MVHDIKPFLRSSTLAVFIITAFTLSGCDKKPTYAWYMQHPEQLKEVIMACASDSQKSPERTAQCDMAMYAAENMQTLINQAQANPELFGQRILGAQMTYADLQKEVVSANVAFESLQMKHVAETQLRTAQDDLYKAKKALTDQGEQIKVMLAVVGLSAPD